MGNSCPELTDGFFRLHVVFQLLLAAWFHCPLLLLQKTQSRNEANSKLGIPNVAGVALPDVEGPDAWNQINKVPLADWLAQDQSDSDKSRLHTLGNCVVPMMAQLASLKLSEMLTLDVK